MLLIISENEACSLDLLEGIFEIVVKTHPTDIYVLIQPRSVAGCHITVSSMIDQMAKIYNQSSKVKAKFGVETSVTVLIKEEEYNTSLASKLWTSVYYTTEVRIDSINDVYIHHVIKDNIHCITVEDHKIHPDLEIDKSQISNPKSTFREVPIVAVGGTFDHIHDGHKILLSASAFLTGEKLIVGVTGPELLKNKKYREYMQSYEERVTKVKAFLGHIRPSLTAEVYEINDVCGPTAKIENIDALVVSSESSKGADFINNVRSELGWRKLQVYTIGVVGSSDSSDFEHKLSSTDYRKLEYLKHHSDDKNE